MACLGCSSDSDSEDSDDGRHRAASFATSGPETGDLFVHGTVRRGGTAVRDAEVAVSLFPEEEDAPVGEVVDTFDAEPAVTDAHGEWAVRLDPETIPSRYFPADHDFLNFDLMVRDEARFAMCSTTLWLVGERGVWRTEGSRTGDALMVIELDLESETITITDSQGHPSTSTLVASDVGS